MGTDSFTYTLTGGNSATVTIKLNGIDNDDVIIGTGAGDTLRGGVGDDQIFGLGGNDLIFGDSGNDTMSGGLGNDRFIVDSASDVVIEAFGEGEDTLSTSVSYTLGAGVYVEIVGTTNNNATTALSLTGNEFDNQIWANAGNNILNGAAGADYMAGYAGNDTYIIDNAADAIRELSGEGNDVARTSVSYRLGTRVHVETLETTDASGTAALRLTGNELANTIIGNAGANIIDGGEGADTLNGGSGNDRYFVDDVGDVIVESLTGGEDMVSARVSYVLNAGAYVEVLGTVSNSATTAINLTGNELANSIQGNQGINVLSGMAGGDYLVGLGGDDVLMGGLGVDNLSGGAGADRFVYENANESTSEARDRILDFDSADVIDLSAIDADLNSAGDQQFTFVGTAGFSRTAGELRVIAGGAGTYVVDADIDGNGTADLSITVNYASVLNAGDFWL